MLLIAKPWTTFYNPQLNCGTSKNTFFVFLLYASTCIFAFWSADTYHSWDEFIDAKNYTTYTYSLYEPVYNWLASYSGGNYFLWRMFIWLPASAILFIVAKKLKIKNGNFLVSLSLFGYALSFTRGMLGHTLLLLGVVLFTDKKNAQIERFCGIVLFILSYYFHKSMFINIFFALIAFFPFGKKYYRYSLYTFPLLTFFATYLIEMISLGSIDISLGEGVGNSVVGYSSAVKMQANIFGYIGRIISYTPIYLTLFYLIDRVLYKEYFKGIEKEYVYTYLFRLTYVSLYIASLFLFVQTSDWIYIRFRYMSFFPMIFVLAKVWSLEKQTNKWIKYIIVMQLFSMFFEWFMRLKTWSEL